MKIEFTQTRELANRKIVEAGQVYDIKDLKITRKEASAYIKNKVAKESKDGSTIHGDS